MKRYKPQNQLSFEQFNTPYEQNLKRDNKWVKLAQEIPWDSCASIYLRSMKDFGRPGIDARLAIGALIIKHMKGLSDREVIEEISENVYLQYFVGFSSFNPEPAFDSSLFVSLRKRMGKEQFDQMNDLIISKALGIKDKSEDGDKDLPEGSDNQSTSSREAPKRNKGKLKMDATVADQMIVYPTDLGLLNRSREELERLIDILYEQSKRSVKPRTYRRKARKQYLSLAMKKKKHKSKLRKSIRQQLGYVRRNIQTINDLWDEVSEQGSPFKYRDLRLFWVIQWVYAQQKKMYDEKIKSHPNRIVNIYQPYVRPIPRGKDKALIEFGAKLGVSEFEGFCRLDHLSWEAYHEGKQDLILQCERYKELKGHYPEVVLVDGIYLSRENRKWLKTKNIRHVGKPLGRPKRLSYYQKRKRKKERGLRNHIEGKFGQGKNSYELNKIRARRQDTSASWIAAIFFALNLVRWHKIMMLLLWLGGQWEFFLTLIFTQLKPQPNTVQRKMEPRRKNLYKHSSGQIIPI